MASLHQFLPSIFLFISIFFFIINGSCSSSTSPPLPFSCGNGVEFGYPFWQKQSHKTVHNYGYPGFGISCINRIPIIELDDHLYHVKSINNTRKTLTVSYHESSGDSICPVASHDVVITSSFLNYSKDVKMMKFLYNCTVYPPGFEPVKCLQIGAKHAYVFMEGMVPKFDWKGDCESMVTVPVMEKNTDGSLVTGFGKALNEGFELKWSSSSDVECGSCEAKGGFCEYDGATKKMVYCHGQGSVSSNFKLRFLSIGLLVCGLTIAATIVYMAKKRKNGVYKRGFNPLPTSGK